MTKPCTPCNATGYRPRYAHVDDGKCWRCAGTGFQPTAAEASAAALANAEAQVAETKARLNEAIVRHRADLTSKRRRRQCREAFAAFYAALDTRETATA